MLATPSKYSSRLQNIKTQYTMSWAYDVRFFNSLNFLFFYRFAWLYYFLKTDTFKSNICRTPEDFMELLVQYDGDGKKKDDLLQTDKSIMNIRLCCVPDI